MSFRYISKTFCFANLWPKRIMHRILQKSYFRLSRSKHPAFQANALLWQILVQTCETLKGHYRTTFCGFSTQAYDLKEEVPFAEIR